MPLMKSVRNYFSLLKKTYADYDFDKHPETVSIIMDETGVPLCPRPPKTIAKKGQKKALQDRNHKLQSLDVAVLQDKLSPPPPLYHFFW